MERGVITCVNYNPHPRAWIVKYGKDAIKYRKVQQLHFVVCVWWWTNRKVKKFNFIRSRHFEVVRDSAAWEGKFAGFVDERI
jgi:hypothetical protein